MRTIVMLAWASLWSRRGTVMLTVLSVATSFALLIAVERLRSTTRSSFESTIAGTDFLVGARGSELQLLLYSVFRLGEPVQEFSWESYERVARHPEVAWAVPLALGDSVEGFRVLGTTSEYFNRYRYGAKRGLEFAAGRAFRAQQTAVLGSEVARKLRWSLGASFPLQHGVSKDAHAHEHARFEVIGVLAPTGTPVDRTVHVPLAGLAMAHHEPVHGHEQADDEEDVEYDGDFDADSADHDHEEVDHVHADSADHGHEQVGHVHADSGDHDHEEVGRVHADSADHGHEEVGHAHPGGHEHEEGAHAQEAHAGSTPSERAHKGAAHAQEASAGSGHAHGDEGAAHAHGAAGESNERLETVSAAMIGLRSKMGLFRMRSWINGFSDEPLMAVMPARAFQRLWSTVGVAEKALRVIGVLVSLAGIVALVATLLATVQARRREMALLRSVGASPAQIGVLIVGEAIIVALSSAVVALAVVYTGGALGRGLLAGYGLRLDQVPVTASELGWVGAFLLTAALVSLIPALVTYRRSLSDGLLVRT